MYQIEMSENLSRSYNQKQSIFEIHSIGLAVENWLGQLHPKTIDKQMKTIYEYYMNARSKDRLRQAIGQIWW